MSSKLPKQKFKAVDLTPGKKYRLVAAFSDYDRILHPVGETWRFLGRDFLPYDDGLTLYIERNGSSSVFRLQWRPETQGEIIDNFSDFVEEL